MEDTDEPKENESEAVPEAAPEAPAEEAPILPPQEIRAVLEALIFSSPQPVTSRQLGQVLGGVPKESWKAVLEDLKQE